MSVVAGAELEQAAELLERHRPDGPCDDRCGCLTAHREDDPDVTPTAVTAKATTAAGPIACTLGAESLAGRLEDWSALLAGATDRSAIDDGVRVELAPETPVDELSRLVAAEQRCCSFFGFAITVDGRGLGLEVRAPHDALAIVHSLFGAPA